MITFPTILGPDGNPLVQQKLTRPAVYLDTWALRWFAEDDLIAGATFRDALLRKGGTLVLSDLNLADFAGFRNVRRAQAAGTFIDTVGANVFFAIYNPFQVIAREPAIMVGQTDQSPAGDREVLQLYAEDRQSNPGVGPIRAWFIAAYAARKGLKSHRNEMAQALLDGIAALQARFDREPGFKTSAFRDVKNSQRPRSTQALLRAIVYRLQGDRKRKWTINDAIDVLHCVVPAAYCDFVLLDRASCARLEDARKWLASVRIKAPVAKCYSPRDVIRFLADLKGWPASNPQSAPT